MITIEEYEKLHKELNDKYDEVEILDKKINLLLLKRKQLMDEIENGVTLLLLAGDKN